MKITESIIGNKNYISFYIDDQYLGKIVYAIRSSNIFIHYIYINPIYRSKGYLKIMINNLEIRHNKDLTLEAKEINEKYNRLINHYIKLGFQINGKERFVYEGEILFRKVPMAKSII